jgi:hypothetical protein
MKSLLLGLTTLLSVSSFGETYVCAIDGTDKTISFGIAKELPTQDGWDVSGIYKLSVQTTELPFAEHSEEGLVNIGDVFFTYKSATSDIEFSMYLDEDEPVAFKLNGSDYTFSSCRYYDFNQD